MRLFVLFLVTFVASGYTQDSLIENGSFEHGFDKWETNMSHVTHLEKNQASLQIEANEEGNHIKAVKKIGDVGVQFGSQTVALPITAKSLIIKAKVKGEDVQSGDAFWTLPGISVVFRLNTGDDKHGDLNKWLFVPLGTSDWQVMTTEIPIREGSVEASIGINSHGWTGAAWFDDIVVEAVEN